MIHIFFYMCITCISNPSTHANFPVAVDNATGATACVITVDDIIIKRADI